MDKISLSICVFAEDSLSFELRKSQIQSETKTSVPMIWCNSKKMQRLEMIEQNLETWILFLDADCELLNDTFIYLVEKIQNLAQNQILAGIYVNPKTSSYFQRVHNLIANSWLKESFKSETEKALLGGVFLIYANKSLLVPTQNQKALFWGAEDKALADYLNKINFKIQLDEKFWVIHHTSRTLKHFIKRAWLHGSHDVTYLEENFKFQYPAAYFYWIRKIEMSDWHLVPAIGVHFLIQKTAKLIQTVLRLNKKK